MTTTQIFELYKIAAQKGYISGLDVPEEADYCTIEDLTDIICGRGGFDGTNAELDAMVLSWKVV